jgi:hypothetical protein
MGLGIEYAPFIILYGIAFEWCYRTAGDPYAAAIAHEAAKKAAKFVGKNVGFAQAVITGNYSSNVLYLVTLYRKNTRALTFENVWQMMRTRRTSPQTCSAPA